jgi:hypothetical protein
VVDIPLACYAILDADRSEEQEEGDAMSGQMLLAVLRMPPDCWDDGPIDVMQRHQRYVQAADEIERGIIERLKTEAYEQAIKDAMAKLAEIKDLPADRCREELRRFVATHNGGA